MCDKGDEILMSISHITHIRRHKSTIMLIEGYGRVRYPPKQHVLPFSERNFWKYSLIHSTQHKVVERDIGDRPYHKARDRYLKSYNSVNSNNE